MVLGGNVTDDATDEWLTLDQKVNTYPTVRGFTAIGTGGDDFVKHGRCAVFSPSTSNSPGPGEAEDVIWKVNTSTCFTLALCIAAKGCFGNQKFGLMVFEF
ncbi:hypothetical protein Tco_0829476 [Tanacetum coccineum]